MRFNSLTIVGRLGNDAEVRMTSGGQPVTSFSVAVSAWKKDAPPQWFRCSWWGDRGPKIAEYMTKGKEVLVQGEVGLFEGNGKASLDVRVLEVQLASGSARQPSPPARRPAPEPDVPELPDESDIPF